MPKIDWSQEDRSTAKPGTYTFEVEDAQLRTGKNSGYEYISLRMRCVDDRSISVFDTLSFSPKAKNILQAKLSGLGMHEIETVEPEDFIGRRVVAAVAIEPDHQGQDRLVVDIRARGSKAGYFPNEEGKPRQQLTIDDLDDNIPF